MSLHELEANLLNSDNDEDIPFSPEFQSNLSHQSSSPNITDKITYLERLLRYSGCWIFVKRPCYGDYIGFAIVICVVISDITVDWMLYFGPHATLDKQCDLSPLFALFSVLKHVEILFRLSFFAFKFRFIWKDPWISKHILNFEAEEITDENDGPSLRKVTSSLLGNWAVQSVPDNYDYMTKSKQSRKNLFNRRRTAIKDQRKLSALQYVSNKNTKRKKYKYPFKLQKMYKRIKYHCLLGCVVISIITIIYRINIAIQLSKHSNESTSMILVIFQIMLSIGSIWTNLSMIIFFAVIFMYNFIAIRYIKWYFHRIIVSCFQNLKENHSNRVLKDLDGSNILQEYDDMYYFIHDNNESFQLWVAWLILYVALVWWIFVSLGIAECSLYHEKSLADIAYSLLYTVNLMILTWFGLRVTKEFNALTTNIADITEEVQFGYSRFTQFSEYSQLLDYQIPKHKSMKKLNTSKSMCGMLNKSSDDEDDRKNVLSIKTITEELSADVSYDLSDDEIENNDKKTLMLREYNKSHHKTRSKNLDEVATSHSLPIQIHDDDNYKLDRGLSERSNYSDKPARYKSIVRQIIDDKGKSISLVHIARLIQLERVLNSRPCTFGIFGITFTKTRIFGSVAAFAIGKIVALALNWSLSHEKK